MSRNNSRQLQFAAFTSPVAERERAKLRTIRDEIARDVAAKRKRRLAIERAQLEAAYDDSWKVGVRPLKR